MASKFLPVLSAGLCVYFLLASVHAKEDKVVAKRLQGCAVLDMVHPVGATWNERCRQCTCTSTGIQCTGGPICTLPYKPEHEYQCAEWEDKCCCKAVGCKLTDGTIIDLDAPLPTNPAKPCESCKCAGGSKTKDCAITVCPALTCLNPTVRPGQCCAVCEPCTLSDGTKIPVGGLMPTDPAKPCERCHCGGGNMTNNCYLTVCPQLSCWPQEKPAGACCRKCGTKCTVSAVVDKDIPGHVARPLEVAFAARYPSKTTGMYYYCICPGSGQVALCNKGS